jgi:hypothetical protein
MAHEKAGDRRKERVCSQSTLSRIEKISKTVFPRTQLSAGNTCKKAHGLQRTVFTAILKNKKTDKKNNFLALCLLYMPFAG